MSVPSQATLDVLRSLVAFETVSRDSNLGMIEWVRDLFASHGLKPRLTYDTAARKANLFATVGEPSRSGGIVLSGHSDVVPVDGQDWSRNPFIATLSEGRVYGRGTADMKGFIAVVLACLPRMLEYQDDEPLHVALSYDEELGCLGVPGLLRDMLESGVKPRACIVGEPTGMNLVVGHKGCCAYRGEVRGAAAHSSLAPRGVNAIGYAARLVAKMEDIAASLQSCERQHSGYDVPHTTVNVGVISGGTAANIVAERCELRFDLRNLPWTSPRSILAELERFAAEELLPEMRTKASAAAVEFTCLAEVPPLEMEASSPLALFVGSLLGTAASAGYVGFGTEGGLFQAAGIPSVVCGPGYITQAHKPDEFVSLEQLALCEQFLSRLISARFSAAQLGRSTHDGRALQ